MGRPLNKKYFGNRNIGSASTITDNGIGGQGVASITQTAGASKTGTLTVVIDPPDLPNGVTALATATVSGGTITFVITEPGSGYSAAPAITVTTTGTNGTGYTYSVVLTTDLGVPATAAGQEPAIIAYAFTAASNLKADINKQVSGRRYKVTTSEGTAICKLVTATAAAVGEMTITATDSSSKTYYVTKLTGHKATLIPYGTTGHEFPLNADGTAQSVRWTLGTATASASVTITNG